MITFVKIGRFFSLLLIVFFLFAPFAVAQKVKKKKKTEKEKPVLSEEDYLKAEIYFIEGEKHFILEEYAEAFEKFRRSLEINPQDAAAHYKMAEILLIGNQTEDALYHASQALSLDPQNKYYHLLLAKAYRTQLELKKAASVYEEMIQKIPGTEQYLYELVILYMYQGDLEKALSTCNKIEAVFGKSKQLSYQKQHIYLKLNKLEAAVDEWETLIEMYPDDPEYMINLVELLLSNDRIEDAANYLDKLAEQFPDYPEARLLLYEVYYKMGDMTMAESNLSAAFEDPALDLNEKLKILAEYIQQLPDSEKEIFAKSLAEKIIKTHPDEANSYAAYGDLLFVLEAKQKARDQYLQAVKLDESNFRAWQNILSIEMEENQLDSVIAHADQALTLFPNQALLYYFSGTAHLIKRDFEEAAFVLEQGKKLASADLALVSVFNSQLGDAYNELQAYDKSDAAYEAALKFDPNNYHVLNNYSYFLSLRKEKLGLAKKMSARLVEDNPDNATFLDTHAWVLYVHGDYKEAKKYLEKALNSNEGKVSGVIIEHYGDVLYRLGDVEGAVNQWEKAKQMEENSDFIDKKIADRKLYE